MQQTKDSLTSVTEKHEFELMLQRQYKHMIHRMRQDIIAEQIRVQEMQANYKSKLAIAEEECEKNRVAKQ